MKKLLAIFLAVCFVFLSACDDSPSTWQPVTASEDLKSYGKQAITIIDQYLDFKIDADEADEQFRSLAQRVLLLHVDENNSKYNNADRVIVETIELYASLSIGYKSDDTLRQTKDVLYVQIGKEPSGKTYNSKDVFNAESEANLGLFVDVKTTSAISGSVIEDNGTYSLLLSFDAMYGTKSSEVRTTVQNVFSNAERQGISLTDVFVTYRYYDQDAFIVSCLAFDDNFSGHIFLGNLDNIFSEFNNKDDMNAALDRIVEFVP